MSPHKFSPKYSGKVSQTFWRRVGLLHVHNRGAWRKAYNLGCHIQELEAKLARLFREAV